MIVNPNTNESITISDITDLYSFGSSNKEFNISFTYFVKPIKFIFESITEFYNYYCPPVVQHFLFLIFVFMISLILIKIFL